jgi:hypothetical protein
MYIYVICIHVKYHEETVSLDGLRLSHWSLYLRVKDDNYIDRRY